MSPLEALRAGGPAHAREIAQRIGWSLEDTYAELVAQEARGRVWQRVSYAKGRRPLVYWVIDHARGLHVG